MASSQTTLELSRKYDHIFAAVGVHPDSAGELIWCPEKCAKYENEIIEASAIKDSEDNLGQEIGNADDSDTEDPYKDITEEICNRNRELLKNLAQQKKVVAIGEIGLDYHWDIWPRDIQKKAFEWQWKLAEELKLPVIIHSRDAAEDTLNMIRGFYETKRNTYDLQKAVMHCYSYSPEHAEEYLKMGLMFGIGGVVTFKNAKKLKEVVDLLPLDKILLETDCPYMAPDPFRGKCNNSGYLTYVAEKIAEIKGVDVKTVYDRTWDNAEEFFDLANV
jgi:TatD DNase family protein